MSQDDHHHQGSCSWSSLHWSSEWCGLRHAEHCKTDTTIIIVVEASVLKRNQYNKYYTVAM